MTITFMVPQREELMKNNRIFIDTSFVIAVFNTDDKLHNRAMELLENLYNSKDLWITDAILYEIGDGLCKTNPKSASEFIKSCINSNHITVIKTDNSLLFNALDRYSSFKDKNWSLTDCISFEVMKENDIDIAYSSDHHFAQAGFQYALR